MCCARRRETVVSTAGRTLAAQLDLGDGIFKALAAKQLSNAASQGLDAQQQDTTLSVAQGYFELVVYSDTEGLVDDPGDYSPHSGYKLYSMEGQGLQSVENRSATDWREPKTLRLGVGRYLVTAFAPHVGLVSVPVVIGDEQTTIVDLNHEVLPGSSVGEQWVRLPNGQVIGAKAQP